MSQTMRVLIAGIDGYLGWPLALHLATRGHEVYGIDNFSRRRNVAEVGSWSAIPIPNMRTRSGNIKMRCLSCENLSRTRSSTWASSHQLPIA